MLPVRALNLCFHRTDINKESVVFNRLVKLKSYLLGTVVALFATHASAAIDTTAVVAEIASNEAAVLAVGAALLALAAVAVGIKWLKGTIFS